MGSLRKASAATLLVQCLLFCLAQPCDAQTVGLEFGYGQTNLSGSFTTCACNNQYDGGSGTGTSASILAEVDISHWVRAGARASLESSKFSSSFLSIRTLIGNAGDTLTFPIAYTGRVKYMQVSLAPYLDAFVGNTGVFVELRPAISVMASSAVTESWALIPGEYSADELTYTNGMTSSSYPQGSLKDLIAVQFTAALGVGYDYHFGSLIFSPMVSVELPITHVQSSQNWLLRTYSGALALKYTL